MEKILKKLFPNKYRFRLTVLTLCLLVLVVIYIVANPKEQPIQSEPTQTKTEATIPSSYMIENVGVLKQDKLKAGCEIYACTMLLQHLGYDMDEFMFSENYLITSPVFYGYGGDLYGPDMDSAYAGDVYTGYGINAPAMAKSMNKYLSTTDKNQKAYPMKDVDLDALCEEYIINDVPVMVWATTNMNEPYVKTYWTVDYVDENADSEKGDTEQWMQNEHCMVLIGFDEENYYFADSVAGEVSCFEKEQTKDKYEKIGSQSIVVK